MYIDIYLSAYNRLGQGFTFIFSPAARSIVTRLSTAEDCRLGIPFIHLLSEYKGNPSSKQMVHSDLGWPAELT